MARAWVVATLVILLALAGCGGKPSTTTGGGAGATTTTAPTGFGLTTNPATAVVSASQTTVYVTPAPVTKTVTVSPSAAPPSTSDSGGGGGGGGGGGEPGLAGDPPLITKVSGVATGPTTGRLGWTVFDDFDGVQSHANYGPGGSLSLATPTQTQNGTYTMDLTGLSACTTYSFQVAATDVGRQSARSPVGSFATPPGPALNSTNVSVVSMMHNSANVTWTVTGSPDASSVLQYGTTTSYGFTTSAGTGPGVQATRLTGLTQNTDYHVRVHVTSPCGTFNTPDQVIHTATLVAVDILANQAFPLQSFTPQGGSAGAPVSAPKDTLLVFQVHNKDASLRHDFTIEGQSYSSGPISFSATTIISPAIKLAASPTGGYVLYSSEDGNAADGTHHKVYGALNVQ